MSGVVFIICVPTENYEKSLQKNVKKKVVIEEPPKYINQKSNDCVINNVDDDFVPLCHSTTSGADIRSKEIDSMEKVVSATVNYKV